MMSRITMPTIVKALLLLAGLLLALSIRLVDFSGWQQHPERVYLNDAPCLTTFDGYEYLRQAEDLAAGAYTPADPLRGYPNKIPRSNPPSLLASVTAQLIISLPIVPRWIAAILPALIGSSLFLCIFLLGRQLGGFRLGLLAGLLAACAPTFVMRSNLGRFDTDCAILPFIVMGLYLSNNLFLSPGRWQQKIVWAVLYLINMGLFFLWWDNVRLVPVILAGLFVFQAYHLPRHHAHNRHQQFYTLLLLMFTFAVPSFLLFKTGNIHHLIERTILTVNAVTDSRRLNDVAEMEYFTFWQMQRDLFGFSLGFVPSLLGLLLLCYRTRVLRPTILCLLALALPAFFGKRFTYFCIPTCCLGSAFFVLESANIAKRFFGRWGSEFIFLSCSGAFILPCVLFIKANTAWPIIPPKVAQGMLEARIATPTDSVIWSWWDNGCPLMYFSRRATIEDNMYNAQPLSVINALPLTLSDERTAANFMRFYIAQGRAGIHRFQEQTTTRTFDLLLSILSTSPMHAAEVLQKHQLSPEEWIPFLFPTNASYPPFYVFLDYLYLPTVQTWFARGHPTNEKTVSPFLQYFYDVTFTPNTIETDSFSVSTTNGMLSANSHPFALSRLLIRYQKQVQDIDYHRPGLVFEADVIHHWAILCDPVVYNSLFNRLFFFARSETTHFTRVWHNPPYGQLWQVTPEEYSDKE